MNIIFREIIDSYLKAFEIIGIYPDSTEVSNSFQQALPGNYKVTVDVRKYWNPKLEIKVDYDTPEDEFFLEWLVGKENDKSVGN